MSCVLAKQLCARPDADNHWALNYYAASCCILMIDWVAKCRRKNVDSTNVDSINVDSTKVDSINVDKQMSTSTNVDRRKSRQVQMSTSTNVQCEISACKIVDILLALFD
jgi:hypothetical protein